MSQSKRLALVAMALTGAVGCRGEMGRGGIVHQTIGGVPSVMNPDRGLLGDTLGWELNQYLLVAGDQLYDGEPALYALDVGILPNGGVVVLDAGNRRVLRFAPDGAYLGSFGGPGSEPGEFRAPFFLEVADSVVYVLDPGVNRASAFDSAGDFLSSFQLDLGGLVWTTPLFEAGAPDEIYVFAEPVPFQAQARDTGRAVVYRVDASGTIADTLLTHAAATWVAIQRPEGGVSFAKHRLSPEPRVAAADGLAASNFAARYSVDLRKPDGALVRRIGRRYRSAPVTQSMRDSILDRLEQGPGLLSREALEMVPFAPVIPAIEDLLLDDQGRLWVDVYAPGETTRWDIFDEAGRFLGPLYLPQPIRLEDVRAGRACGIMSEEFSGQAAVVCYRVVA